MKQIIYKVFEFRIEGQLRFEIDEAEVIRETKKRYYTSGYPRAFHNCNYADKGNSGISFSKQDALRYYIRMKKAKISEIEREKKGIEEIIKIASGMLNDGGK